MGLPLQPVHRNDPLSRNSDPSELQELRGEPAVGAGGCGLLPLTTQFHCSNVWNLRNVNINIYIWLYIHIYIILYEISKLSISSTIEHGMNFLLRSPNSPGFSPGAVARCDGAWHRRRKSSNWKTVARSPWIGGTLSIDLLRPRCPPIRIVFCWPTWTWWKLRFMGIWLKTWIYIYICHYIWLYMTILHWI